MDNRGIKLAYIAGVLDGDGSFSLIKSSPRTLSRSPLYTPMIQLANVSRKLIDLFNDEFGGYVNTRKAYIADDGHARQECHAWKIKGVDGCLQFIESISQYLVIKKDRAEFLRNYIVAHPFIRGSNKLNDEELFKREKAYLAMLRYNQLPCTSCQLNKNKQFDSTDEQFWSYIAGLMDTDGSFSIKREDKKRKNMTYIPVILLTMTDCRAIYSLMNNFVGGNLYIAKAKTAKNGFCYRFMITSKDKCAKFLRNIIPYLQVKHDQANVLLKFCENMVLTKCRMNGVGVDELIFREQCYADIIKLNNGVYKSHLIVLKPLPDNAEGNKVQAGKPCSTNAVSDGTTKVDAVL
jgi:hypothetical protein